MTSQIPNNLTPDEEAILIGGLLGDEILIKRGNSFRYRVLHGIHQKQYVDWKHSKLIRICQTTATPHECSPTREGHRRYEFYTSSGLYLKELHERFYEKQPNGRWKKKISPELVNSFSLNPLMVAVWWLDDGSVRNDCYAGRINAQGFSREEQNLLCIYLNRFGIEAHIVTYTYSSGQFYISIPAHTFGYLADLIEPIVREVPAMEYKLNELRRPRNDFRG